MTDARNRISGTVEEAAARLMPELIADLCRLVRIPSISAAGHPPEPLFAAHDLIVELLRGAGVEDIDDLVLEGRTAPVIVATVPGPEGAPTVLLHTHYDVVPADDTDLWESPPFEPDERDGAIYGRGTADSKAEIVGIIGALRIFGGAPPVTLRIVLDGHGQAGGPFGVHPIDASDLFESDAMVIADFGSVRPGVPTLTVALRGSASVTIAVDTLATDKHSGVYCGAAPDARLALIHALASVHDEDGDVAVDGVRRETWTGASYTEEEFRDLAEILEGRPLFGTGGLGERIWSGPAITVTGFDAPSVDRSVDAVAGSARASLTLRVHPEQDAAEAQDALVRHFEALRPLGQRLVVTAGETGNGFAVGAGGPAFDAAIDALEQAWGTSVGLPAGGGSIPLVTALHEAVPRAEKLLFGVTDGYANVRGPNERALLDELEKAIVTKVLFCRGYGRRYEEWS